MSEMDPRALTAAEWDEIAAIPDIRQAWGLSEGENGTALSGLAYAARFNFVSGSPGYVGELFVLQGDVLTGDPPMVLRRGPNKELIFC